MQQTPLHVAAAKGNGQIVLALIARGASPNVQDANGQYAIESLVSGRHADLLRVLLKAGAVCPTKANGDVLLHRAAFNGDPATAQALIDWGAVVRARNQAGETPLHHAFHEAWEELCVGHRRVAEILLARGADINARDTRGRTALGWLTGGKNRQNAIAFLKEHGATE